MAVSDNYHDQLSVIMDDTKTLLYDYSCTTHTKGMEKLAGTEPVYAQAREMLQRDVDSEIKKKELKRKKLDLNF